MASKEETEIRKAVVDWFHTNEPQGRVVHELNVATGTRRADLGIVFPDTLVLVEIKSKKDNLNRLEKQFNAFSLHSQHTIIVADDVHFSDNKLKDQAWIKWSHNECVWRYPETEKWTFDRYRQYHPPHNYNFLDLLWQEELADEMKRAGLYCPSGHPRWNMKRDLEHKLGGGKIREAVCRKLRQRVFANADPQIVEMKNAH